MPDQVILVTTADRVGIMSNPVDIYAEDFRMPGALIFSARKNLSALG